MVVEESVLVEAGQQFFHCLHVAKRAERLKNQMAAVDGGVFEVGEQRAHQRMVFLAGTGLVFGDEVGKVSPLHALSALIGKGQLLHGGTVGKEVVPHKAGFLPAPAGEGFGIGNQLFNMPKRATQPPLVRRLNRETLTEKAELPPDFRRPPLRQALASIAAQP